MLLAGTCTTSVYKQCKVPLFFKKSAWQYHSVPGILDSQDSPFIDMCIYPSHLPDLLTHPDNLPKPTVNFPKPTDRLPGPLDNLPEPAHNISHYRQYRHHKFHQISQFFLPNITILTKFNDVDQISQF